MKNAYKLLESLDDTQEAQKRENIFWRRRTIKVIDTS
jgi:hypothetical protein